MPYALGPAASCGHRFCLLNQSEVNLGFQRLNPKGYWTRSSNHQDDPSDPRILYQLYQLARLKILFDLRPSKYHLFWDCPYIIYNNVYNSILPVLEGFVPKSETDCPVKVTLFYMRLKRFQKFKNIIHTWLCKAFKGHLKVFNRIKILPTFTLSNFYFTNFGPLI